MHAPSQSSLVPAPHLNITDQRGCVALVQANDAVALGHLLEAVPRAGEVLAGRSSAGALGSSDDSGLAHHGHAGAHQLGGGGDEGAGNTGSATSHPGVQVVDLVGAAHLLQLSADLVEGGEVHTQQDHVGEQRGHGTGVQGHGTLVEHLRSTVPLIELQSAALDSDQYCDCDIVRQTCTICRKFNS
jgi:hypothetical protein